MCIELEYIKFEKEFLQTSYNFVWLLCSCSLFIYLFIFAVFFKGISATSEDIPNKIEDLRSECSSDFGGKDSVTSPDMDDIAHGK